MGGGKGSEDLGFGMAVGIEGVSLGFWRIRVGCWMVDEVDVKA